MPGRRTASIAAQATTGGWRSPCAATTNGRRLCDAIAAACPCDDARFATHDARIANEDALDAAIEPWTQHARPLRSDGLLARPPASPRARSRTRTTSRSAIPSLPRAAFFGTATARPWGEYGIDRFPALFNGERPAMYEESVHQTGADTFDVLTDLLGLSRRGSRGPDGRRARSPDGAGRFVQPARSATLAASHSPSEQSVAPAPLLVTRPSAVREFTTVTPGVVRMYVCGVTPYDVTHLGHAFSLRPVRFASALPASLGNDVRYVQNITDIDDDMIMVSKRQGGRPSPRSAMRTTLSSAPTSTA